MKALHTKNELEELSVLYAYLPNMIDSIQEEETIDITTPKYLSLIDKINERVQDLRNAIIEELKKYESLIGTKVTIISNPLEIYTINRPLFFVKPSSREESDIQIKLIGQDGKKYYSYLSKLEKV